MIKKCLAVGIILLFVAVAFSPVSTAQVSPPQTNTIKASQVAPVRKVTCADDEYFFNFAIIWGTFEEKIVNIPFFSLAVSNRHPWFNLTMYVIGYQNWVPQWVFKKAYQIECWDLHFGIVGFHRLAVIAYGNIAAF